MNRDYIDWLEKCPAIASCIRPTSGWANGRHCLNMLICLATRSFSRSGITVIAPTLWCLACGVGLGA